MAGGAADAGFLNQLNTLAQIGVVGSLSDGQLLQLVLTMQDGAAHAAFTVLVRRHGPMALRVCRQILGDTQDAEDAFQATFLVLARESASVRKACHFPTFSRTDGAREVRRRVRAADLRGQRSFPSFRNWPLSLRVNPGRGRYLFKPWCQLFLVGAGGRLAGLANIGILGKAWVGQTSLTEISDLAMAHSEHRKSPWRARVLAKRCPARLG